jgi:glycosyltransferase involved in cell wall biosynthesis
MKRLAIVASHVIQYQDPFFRLLAQEPDIDLTVLYCSRAGAETYRDEDMKATLAWDIDLLQGYRFRFLRNLARDTNAGYMRLINPGIVPALLRGRYDAVIFMFGWGAITALLGMAACWIRRTPFFLYGDSSFPPPERTFRSKVRAWFLRRLFARASGFMVSGKLNADYYRHYGADERRFFLLPWAVDNARFAAASPGGLRKQYGIAPDAVVLLFSAKLVARKDPMTLLRAFEAMAHRGRAALVFMGDGQLRAALEAYARRRQIEQVHFTGFINQREIPGHYAMSDVFVLPSVYEPRGAVINEAMACGLPVIVTDRCGSIGDIVQENDNAFVYPAGDAVALRDALDTIVADDALRARMGQRSREIIADWDFARGVRGVRAMLDRVKTR